MMTTTPSEQKYVSDVCQSTCSVAAHQDIPVCCNRPMTPLPLDQCTEVHPEMAHNLDASEPCDDGRGQGDQSDPKAGK